MRTTVFQPIELSLGKRFTAESVVVSGNKARVSLPVFRKADGLFYARFSATKPGTFSYRNGRKKQAIEVVPYTGREPLFVHGIIEVSREKTYLMHHDGTPFFYFADTWWFGGTKRLPFPKRFFTLLADRKKKGFTAIQMVVGIPPEVEAFSSDAANEGGLPFRDDWTINPEYFDAIDKRVEALVKSGIVPVIFGGWGHHIDWMGTENMMRFWREIIARYASYPVIFSLCGEVDVFLTPKGSDPQAAERTRKKLKKVAHYLPRPLFSVLKSMKQIATKMFFVQDERGLLKRRVDKWREVGVYASSLDPYSRVMTVHPHRQLTAFDLLGNPSWLTLNAVQTGHALSSFPFLVTSLTNAKKPIINLEPWYEGIMGNFDAYYQRIAFFASVLSGAKGHTYGAHGIWQMADGDNFMQHWGASDWSRGLSYIGARQLGLAVGMLSKLDWSTLNADQGLISYEANKKLRFPPIAAVTKKHSIVYIPDQEGLSEVSLKTKGRGVMYNPRTLKKIGRAPFGKVAMPVLKPSRDVLLIYTK